MTTLGFRKDLPALINIDLLNFVKELKIKDFPSVFMRDDLPEEWNVQEVGIVNLDSSNGVGTHWVCYSKKNEECYCFDSFGLDPPKEIINYLKGTSRKLADAKDNKSRKGSPKDSPVNSIELSTFQIQEFNTHHCGYYCLLLLKLSEQFAFTDSVLSLLTHNVHKPVY